MWIWYVIHTAVMEVVVLSTLGVGNAQMVKSKVRNLENKPTVHHTIGTLQVAMTAYLAVVNIRHAL